MLKARKTGDGIWVGPDYNHDDDPQPPRRDSWPVLIFALVLALIGLRLVLGS